MKQEKRHIVNLILGTKTDELRKSTLQLALKQARALICYNGKASRQNLLFHYSLDSEGEEMLQSVFEADKNENMNVFTSLCLYLIVLDQLGHIFGDRHCKKSNRTGIAISNSQLYNVQEKDLKIKAIEGLRNSINHNFGLACYNPKSDIGEIKYTLCFNDDGDKQDPIVLAKEKWQGNWCDKRKETATYIYPFSLMNLIEKVLEKHITKYTNGEIDTLLCVEELKTRFTIIT